MATAGQERLVPYRPGPTYAGFDVRVFGDMARSPMPNPAIEAAIATAILEALRPYGVEEVQVETDESD